jgi:hypothetical protein
MPSFSGVDIPENACFVPEAVAPHAVHGAIVVG